MINAQISAIKSNNGVTVFEFQSTNLSLKMLGLENLQGLKTGDRVRLNFKSSDVIIATAPLQNCSLTNEINATITNFDKGEIASVLHLNAGEFEFESIISTDSFKRLNLAKGTQIYAYVKATSLHIDGVLDD